MRTNFYIDAFNLYYGCLKDTAHKWLNLEEFCRLHFPADRVHRIRYCTALVKPLPHDPQQPARQATYLRALQTLPCVSIHLGYYLVKPATMPLHNPPPGTPPPALVRVTKTEEKGSDVNLATCLLVDAFDNDFEQAVVVSNDSDLVEPIRVVRQKFNLPVVVLIPHRPGRRPSFHLSQVASSSPLVNPAHLATAQFGNPLTDARGQFHKPAGW